MIMYRSGDRFFSSLVVAKRETLAALAPRQTQVIMKCDTGALSTKALVIATANGQAPWDETVAATVKGRNKKTAQEKELGPITKDTPDEEVVWFYGKRGAEPARRGSVPADQVLRDW